MGRIRDAWQAITKRDQVSDVLSARARASSGGGKVSVTPDSALRHSAVWACLRLRADLISTMPVDAYRRVAGVQSEVTKPAWLDEPSPGVDITEWMWATQFDLDRYGNAFGLITSVDSAGRPASIELLPAGEISVKTSGRTITGYKLGGSSYDPSMIWHERQYAPAGFPLGLSPIAFAAMSIGGYLSAQQFALDWYASGAQPAGVLRNTEIKTVADQSAAAKAQFKASVESRDIFVTGKDWEWKPATGDANSAAFLDEMKYGIGDVCRFLGVPGDMIDAESSAGSITYANVTQRNLQLLVLNLGPAVMRRERKLSTALAKPRFVKLNSAALLRMDPQTQASMLGSMILTRQITSDEARGLLDRPPFTEDDYTQIERLLGAVSKVPQPTLARDVWAPPWSPEAVITASATDPTSPRAIESGWAPPSTEGQR